jgi:formylglycine-generating enzyme required for sulfatase activity
MPCSGSFADVYQVHGPDGRRWAVKCFTRQVLGQRERYAAISAHLGQARLRFTVEFQYLEQGIRVHGHWYPALKMDWVEGFLLNEFVRRHVDRPATLEALADLWTRMARRLRGAGMAHGDLQHGNVLLVPGRDVKSLALKLIDYDGMFVPTLARVPSGEVGHPAYQHPQRLREATYSAEVDRFPLLVIYVAIRALIVGGRSLWDRYDNGDNLLFRADDIQAPATSALFHELLKLDDPSIRALAGTLIDAARKPIAQSPLLEELISGEESFPTLTRGDPAIPPPVRVSGTVLAPTTEPTEVVVAEYAGARRRGSRRFLWIALGSTTAVISLAVLVTVFVLAANMGTSGGQPTEPPQSREQPTEPLQSGRQPREPLPNKYKNSLGMEFVLVPKGKSWLGGGGGKPGEKEVEIAYGFYLGAYVVTQQEWQDLMGNNPSHFSRTGKGKDAVQDIPDEELKRFPVEWVSWDDALLFLVALNKRAKESEWVYRLPTEVEWEYACRGGPLSQKEDSAFDFYLAKPTNQLRPDQTNFGSQHTCKVGSYEPNRLGLYDMHGNVWEWCDDRDVDAYGLLHQSKGDSLRVERGGCWHDGPGPFRYTSARISFPASYRNNDHGFRVARIRSEKKIK